MVDLEQDKNGAYFWLLDSLPEYINVWIFKTNRVSGKGEYISAQKHPSGVTLRYIQQGTWDIKMCGVEYIAKPGDLFCAIPAEPIIFRQLDKTDWEWLEIQFNGSCAENFIREFGLSRTQPVITPSDSASAKQLFLDIRELMKQRDRSVPDALALMFKLVAACGKDCGSDIEKPYSSRESLVARAIDYIESMPSLKMNVGELAEYFGVDRTTLCRAFKEQTGGSPHYYIDGVKYGRTTELLTSTSMSIAEISHNIGFPDVKYFIGWFKKKTGCTPGNFRKCCKK